MNNKEAAALLCIDIGNTTIGLCLYENAQKNRISQAIKMPVAPLKAASEYRLFIKNIIADLLSNKQRIDTIICSVVPRATKLLSKAAESAGSTKPLIVSSRLETGLRFNIPDPLSTGADRIANAAAAYAIFESPCIIVDSGSATTLTVVGKNGAYLGGAILPGMDTMLNSLKTSTAQLRTGKLSPETPALGTNTDSAISSGIIVGTAGAVKELILRIKKETKLNFRVVLTGGNAMTMHNHLCTKHLFMPELTFEGLRVIYNKSLANR